MCNLNVHAERDTWGRLFQTEMVLGTKDDCNELVRTGGWYRRDR